MTAVLIGALASGPMPAQAREACEWHRVHGQALRTESPTFVEDDVDSYFAWRGRVVVRKCGDEYAVRLKRETWRKFRVT